MVLLKITLVFIGLVLGIGFSTKGVNSVFSDIGKSVLVTLQAPDTISLSIIVGIILVLSELLQSSGQMTELGQLIIKNFGLRRWTYTILPAIIGLLPMPGGALFTAPMMDEVSETCIPAHKKTLINYWFRHIWEYAWPLYPGLVLAAGLAKVNLNTLALIQSPLTVISALIGAALILPGIRISDTQAHKGSFRALIRMFHLISPIILIILLFVAFQLDMLICISAGLTLSVFNIITSKKLKLIEILKVIF